MLLDLLLEIEKLTPPQRVEYATGLYMTNRTFANLCDLTYRRSMVARYIDRTLPSYKQDPVPYGYNYSQLEKVYNKIKIAGFIEHGNEKILDEKIADRKIAQVFESISDIECLFVTYVLRKEIPWFDREAWKSAKHS